MYPPHHLGGYELDWASSVRALQADGHDVRVLTTDLRLPLQRTEEAEPTVERTLRWYWEDHRFPRMGPRAVVALERHNAETASSAIDRHRPDVVCWWAMGGMSLSLIENVRRRGLPALGVAYDDWMAYGPLVDHWTRTWRRVRALAPLAARVTSLPTTLDLSASARWLFASEHTRAEALRSAGPLADTGVLNPGVRLEEFAQRSRPEWQWRLLYVGRIDPRKGIAVAIKALVHLPQAASLTVAGSGDERHLAELRTLAARLGLAGRVEFAPRADPAALAAAYAACDALIFPSQWEEPWGLVPLEGMAVGAPVLATGTGGSAEYLRDEENCLLFAPRADPAALAAAVERLAEDPALRARLESAGRETAERHSGANADAAILSELERAIARGGR